MNRFLAALLAVSLATGLQADDQRALVNYKIHCQGCHLPEAVGYPGKVPRMKNFVGYFLHSREGREFLVRVPGVSTSSLGDEQLTELMNWLLRTYSSEQLPVNFAPFTASEVAALRPDIERDPETARKAILAGIAAGVPELAQAMAAD